MLMDGQIRAQALTCMNPVVLVRAGQSGSLCDQHHDHGVAASAPASLYVAQPIASLQQHAPGNECDSKFVENS